MSGDNGSETQLIVGLANELWSRNNIRETKHSFFIDDLDDGWVQTVYHIIAEREVGFMGDLLRRSDINPHTIIFQFNWFHAEDKNGINSFAG